MLRMSFNKQIISFRPLAAKNFVRRDALLGLGAKPEDLPESDRQNRRNAYQFSDTNLLVPRLKESSRGSSCSNTPADDRRRSRPRSRSRSPSQQTSSSRPRSRSPPRNSRRREDSRERSSKRSRRERSRSYDRYKRSKDDSRRRR
jgi:hypothetical protein